MSDINIIIMRDRGQSHSFHFSPTTFKIVISLLIIIPLLFILSIWFGLSSYSKYVAVLEKTASLEQSIEQNKQTITRLANLERFLQKYSPDMLGLLIPTEEVALDNLPVIAGDKGMLTGELADSLAGSKMSFDIIENEKNNTEEKSIDKTASEQNAENQTNSALTKEETDVQAQETDKAEASSEIVQEQNAQTQAAENPAEETAAPAQERGQEGVITQKVDLGYLEIENFHAKLSAQTVDINYQLKNLGKQVQLEGRQKYYLSSLIDGKLALQELPNASNSTFKIRKLKNVSSSVSIEGMKLGEKVQVVVDVILDNQIVFRQVYPLAR